MIEKNYLNNYMLSFNVINNILEYFTNDITYSNMLKKEIPLNPSICSTYFNYPINTFCIGSGKNHVLLFANTHGCEIVTSHFLLEFITTLLLDKELSNNYLNDFTFHFIPILNPEGYIISTSNVLKNIDINDKKQIETISSKYLEMYNLDDTIAREKKVKFKHYKEVLCTSLSYIEDIYLRNSVKKIIHNCNLNSDILPVWSANGLGFDPNSNSIHKFREMLKLRKSQKCASLRYNDIPVCMPSPMSYPGKKPLDPKCRENVFLYNYIQNLYTYNTKKNCDDKLKLILSYHSTGGEIYGYPDKCTSSKTQLDIHKKAVEIYSKYTNYLPIDENLKYGVMDFYRQNLENVVSLTIELSKKNANPIGPYSNLNDLEQEFTSNKIAIFKLLDSMK
jgi:hypothetical protein